MGSISLAEPISSEFDDLFRELAGLGERAAPFPWQRALFTEFLEGRFPSSCGIPTGLGKTSVIAIWVVALARHARDGTLRGFLRRLVYVVNRQTVVDQPTREAEGRRQALSSRPEPAVLIAPKARSCV